MIQQPQLLWSSRIDQLIVTLAGLPGDDQTVFRAFSVQMSLFWAQIGHNHFSNV